MKVGRKATGLILRKIAGLLYNIKGIVMKKTYTTPVLKKIDSIAKITLGGSTAGASDGNINNGQYAS